MEFQSKPPINEYVAYRLRNGPSITIDSIVVSLSMNTFMNNCQNDFYCRFIAFRGPSKTNIDSNSRRMRGWGEGGREGGREAIENISKISREKKNNTPIVNYNNVVECLNQAESHSMPSKSVGNATGSPWRHDGRGGGRRACHLAAPPRNLRNP